MKIIINKTNELQDVSDKTALRLINKGKAHPAKIETAVVVDLGKPGEVGKVFVRPKKELIDTPDEIFEVPKKRSRRKKNKSWND